MATIITILIIVALALLVRCLRFAYTSARDNNGGGYPIYGDAVHNGGIVGIAAVLAGQSETIYAPYQRTLVLCAVAVFVLNVWLIWLFTNAGDDARRRRERPAPK